MSETQQAKRIRKRSLRLQLEAALRDAEAAATADISTQKLVQTRLTTLTRLLNRERSDKLRKALDTVAVLRTENARLREENARLQQERPTRYRDAEIDEALARYERSKNEPTTEV
jgi:FtsZ-binding cell division protein ZapB